MDKEFGRGSVRLRNRQLLLLSGDEERAGRWNELLREFGDLKRVANLADLRRHLQSGSAVDALLCGWFYQGGTWHEALEVVREHCPDLPTIVFFDNGCEHDWIRVLEAGAFDLLVAPYERRTVFPLLEQAIASYEARRFRHTGSYARAGAA